MRTGATVSASSGGAAVGIVPNTGTAAVDATVGTAVAATESASAPPEICAFSLVNCLPSAATCVRNDRLMVNGQTLMVGVPTLS